MANDVISASLKLSLSNAGLKMNYDSGTVKFDQTTQAKVEGSQEIGFAAHEAIDLGSVATPGWAFFVNLDTLNFVEIGIDVAAAFHPFAKLRFGEFAVVPLGTAAPYAKADTAAVNLSYGILDV